MNTTNMIPMTRKKLALVTPLVMTQILRMRETKSMQYQTCVIACCSEQWKSRKNKIQNLDPQCYYPASAYGDAYDSDKEDDFFLFYERGPASNPTSSSMTWTDTEFSVWDVEPWEAPFDWDSVGWDERPLPIQLGVGTLNERK